MTKSAVAYFVGKLNTEVALLTAQQAATTAEHNARYVNGAGSGQLWIDKDAADVAAAVSAATAAAGALAAAAVRSPQLSIVTTGNGNAATTTIPVSGIWVIVSTRTASTSGGGGAGISGSTGFNGTIITCNTSGAGGSNDLGGVWMGFISAGAVVSTGYNGSGGVCTNWCYFIPTPAYPH